MHALTREDLLQLKPAIYLVGGYMDSEGKPRREFLSEYATAAATQLMAWDLSPQELALTVEGVRQILPMHHGAPLERLRAALDECLLVVARAIRQENNHGLVEWLSECASVVGTNADLDAFLAHIQAVMRLYALVVMSQPDSSDSSRPK